MPETAPAEAPLAAPRHERKFHSDVAWNFASLAVLGVSGIALNVLIGRYYDPDALGVFQQVLATYTIFSMLAVGGINLSALRAIAEHAHDRGAVTAIIVGALVPTVALAALATAIYVLARGPIGQLLESEPVARGLLISAPGLFFFALNKVLLSIVNGVQRMRAFAIYQSLRYLLILIGLLGFVVLDVRRERGGELAFVFTFAETLLFLPLAVETARQISRPVPAGWRGWSTVHLRYGVRSFASGILLEVNAKVDVWMLGIFLADSEVGVYAFGGLVAEGVYQILIVLQNVYNPILARGLAARDDAALRAMISKGKRLTYLGMFAVGVIAIVLYPHAVRILTDKEDLQRSWLPFSLLIGGIFLSSGYIPFGQALLMGGRPGWHTLYMVSSVAFNVVGNSLLIPRYGLAGAALSTALSMVASVFVLRFFVKRELGLRL
jgi:O-antigen/teichoic acid export membrane protein